jgi:hypothetical protein
MHPEARLAALGLSLPRPIPPSEHYVPFKRVGHVLYLSGHGPRRPDGSYVLGRLATADDVGMGSRRISESGHVRTFDTILQSRAK